MQIGAHVSISGSIANAITNASKRECSAFQVFTSNPRGWHAKDLTDDGITNYKNNLSQSNIDRFATVAHMPYLPNLSSPEISVYEKSIHTMIREVERCDKLGIPYLVTHLGSHKGTGEDKGIQRLVGALTEVAKTNKDVTILLENTAGQKNSVGSDFTQLAEIFFGLKPASRFGICIDTCHAFAAGYDLRNEKNVKDVFEKFDSEIGLKHIKIIHLNDSKGELGCHLDRHEHIGLGHIGEAGLSQVVKLANKNKIPIILETPIDERRTDFENIRKAKELA
ncbi:MAG TPA: deoxyribonuclease IV [Candidatus Marinimicrobia bacterium]|nr:deoxyribonuclease IV [Candidatus Neomarinimicrobiota bacterium]